MEDNMTDGRRSWKDKTDEEIREFAEKEGYVGLSSSELRKEDEGFYHVLQERDLLGGIVEREQKPAGYWSGEEGLERAKELIQDFFEEKGEVPARKDVPAGVRTTIKGGKYEDCDIESFNDFLEYCNTPVEN